MFYWLFRYHVFLITIFYFLFSIFLFTLNIKNPDSLSFPERLIFRITMPAQKIIAKLAHFPVYVWDNYIFISTIIEENIVLKKEINSLKTKNNKLLETFLSYKREDKLLNLTNILPYPLLIASVIGRDTSLWHRNILIDKGTNDGVKKGFPVITDNGVVGKILKVWDFSSRVLLITDHNFAVDGIVQRNRIKGIVTGFDDNTCFFKYILATEDIKERDIVISSGLDGIFPKGIIIGEIKKKSTDNTGVFFHVEIKTSVNTKKLEEVLVILPTQPK